MGSKLVIVESPAKAKTIKKYLGKDVEVLASYGHVRDLLPKEGAVDTINDFAMKYQVIDCNSKHVDAIAKAMKKADTLYLATDPDREGEAISWHLYELLKKKGALKNKEAHRVVFHEITKQAVNDAVANPRELSMDLVNAQQARRALDYLVGFTLSPLLWKKVRRGLSAGRVQSPALRMIVERELEIEAFKPQEYWTIEADAVFDKQAFEAKLTHYQGEKLAQFTINNETGSTEAVETLNKAAEGKLLVTNVTKKQRKRNPAAPFTTSTLQQEASRKLGFGAQRTMSVAQQLYEGVDTGEGAAGLITYMRTDSVSLADEAVQEIRGLIAEKYGETSVPKSPQTYKTKSKNAQEAHEAVRPTSILRTPEDMKTYLSADQLKLPADDNRVPRHLRLRTRPPRHGPAARARDPPALPHHRSLGEGPTRTSRTVRKQQRRFRGRLARRLVHATDDRQRVRHHRGVTRGGQHPTRAPRRGRLVVRAVLRRHANDDPGRTRRSSRG